MRRSRTTIVSRIGTAAASLLLLLVYVLPIWRIDLDAPQYPEGLGMFIEVDNVRGVNPGNLESINALNHYIGMKTISPDSIPELDIMPWLIAGLVLLGLIAAATGRRWGLYVWVGMFVAVALIGLADFYRWEYDYGHNLDTERAIIKVPGTSYQPPLIGSKQMLNITATSMPASGGIAVFVSLLIGLSLMAGELRLGSRAAMSGVALLILVLTGCTGGPRPIAYGEDACYHCRMTLTDPRFGTEFITNKGKVHTFDSIECLRSFLAAPHEGTAYVTDLNRPEMLISAEKAYFVSNGAVKSPMGANLGAYADKGIRDRVVDEGGGEALSWEEVLMHDHHLRDAGFR